MVEYGEQIESTYFNIPQNVKNVMGDMSKYIFDFDSNIYPLSEKIPHRKLILKGSKEEGKVDNLPWKESSVEGEEDSDEDGEAKDVSQEDRNNLVLSEPEGLTLLIVELEGKPQVSFA